MALLSQMFRTAAISGRTDTMNAWFADRQSGRWAEQMVGDAFPQLPGSPPARAKALAELNDLHARGIVNDEEYKRLRARLPQA